jgi:bacteriochlorophyllide c C-7(1)-hydroxylase
MTLTTKQLLPPERDRKGENSMNEKRNITKEDILLKARLLTEGIRVEVKAPSSRHSKNPGAPPLIVFDGCDVVAPAYQNMRSTLELVTDGDHGTISEFGEVLMTVELPVRSPWLDLPLSDGVSTVDSVMGYESIVGAIDINPGCSVAAAGKGCEFCAFGPQLEEMYAGLPNDVSVKQMLATQEKAIEGRITAIRAGWRGLFLLAGGASTPARRGQWTTDMIEATMERIRRDVDDATLSEIQMATDVYPPKDLGELEKWKSFGIQSCEFDNQVMHPRYFKAICPGRGKQQHWFEAQEAAVEIFGRGRGCVSNVVAGCEPLDGMIEGIEERMSKGVYVQPVTFGGVPGAPMDGMRPPGAEWYVEAAERIVDIYFKYADTLDVDLRDDDRWGTTRRGQSWFTSPSDDEKSRRLQEMGKLPPGLPRQDGVEVQSLASNGG